MHECTQIERSIPSTMPSQSSVSFALTPSPPVEFFFEIAHSFGGFGHT